jgi:hypothetical protein
MVDGRLTGYKEKNPMQKACLLLSLVFLLTWGAGQSCAQETIVRFPAGSAVKMVPELLVIRPVTGVLALVPTSAFIATLPVTYPLGFSQKAASYLVEKPWQYVANRPFGVFLEQQNVMAQSNEQLNKQYSEFLGRTGADRDLLDLR